MVNIFYLADDPEECVMSYHDKQVKIMFVEVAMILYGIHKKIDEVKYPFNKTVNMGLNVCKWICESTYNYMYAAKLGLALLDEYKYRFDKDNPTYREYYKWLVQNVPSGLPQIGKTPFRLSKNVEAYHTHYNEEDACKLSYVDYKLKTKREWTRRQEPDWIQIYVERSNLEKQSLRNQIRAAKIDDSEFETALVSLFGKNFRKNKFMYGKMFDFNLPILDQLGSGHLKELTNLINKNK